MDQSPVVQDIDKFVPEERDDQAKDQGNRVKYSKFMQEQWLAIEKKSFNQFEMRVLDTLTKLGEDKAELITGKSQLEQPKEQVKEDTKKKAKKEVKEVKEAPQEVVIGEICLGQEIYVNVIRPKLVDFKIVPKVQIEEDEEETNAKDSKKKTKAQKPGAGQKNKQNVMKKDDLMRLQLSKDKVADATIKMFTMMGLIQQANVDIKLFEEEFLRVEQAAKRIKSIKWLELKFAALLVYADQLIKCHLETKLREEFSFELIYFLKNVYIKYQDYVGQSYFDAYKSEKVSSEIMKDVYRKLKELNKHFKFSNRVLFNRYPRLVIDTDMNQSFQQTDVKPYKAQVDLLDVLASASKPSLVFLNTMVGTGKTVLSVAITQFLQKLRTESNSDANKQKFQDTMLKEADLSQMQILYCCPLDNVRQQVGAAAYAKKLPFAVASMWKNPEIKNQKKEQEAKELGFDECARVVNSFSCRNQAFPTLIISDFRTTLELLKEKKSMSESEKTVIRWQGKNKKYLPENPSKDGDQYILFIDEPTVDADFKDAETTRLLTEIMLKAPPITILSSATLPPKEKLPNFIKLFQKKFGDIDIPTINSTQFQIGCQIFSHLGRKFLPHYRVTNKQQLKTVLDRLIQNPFMQRCYNANAFCELNDRMKKCGITDIEDFEQFDLITQEIVQKKSIELLQKLLNEDDSLIEKICQEAEPEEENDEADGTMEINFDEPEETKMDDEDKIKFSAPYKTLKVRELAGKMAHKFNGGCLITVNDPQRLVRDKFSWLLKDVKTANDYIKQYEKQLVVLEKMKEKKAKDIDNVDERTKEIQAIEESMKLSIDFPDKLRINTLEHYKRYVAGSNIQMLNRYQARKAFSIEALNLELDVPDDILLYLFAGIAVYTEKVKSFYQSKSSNLDPDYYKEVQALASNGQLAFIVSDDSMCYGVNYPLNHVIVFDEMAEQRSMGALFQLIGRAGRVGVSWVANAYLEQKSFERLVSYLEGNNQDENDPRDEAYNMELLAKRKIEEIRAEIKRKRELRKEQEEKEQNEKEQNE